MLLDVHQIAKLCISDVVLKHISVWKLKYERLRPLDMPTVCISLVT